MNAPATHKAVGNTYKAKDALKAAGFTWSPATKTWYATQEAVDELARIATPTHNKKYANAIADLEIVAL